MVFDGCVRLQSCFALALFCLIATSPVRRLAAADWNEFRGPSQGHSPETGLPLQWSRKKNVDWLAEVPGNGWSSPIVVGSKVFLTTAVPSGQAGGQSLRAVAIDARSGKILWDVEVFQQAQSRIHSKNSHASATPIADSDSVYVHFGTHGTARIDFLGKILWRNTDQKYRPVHGNGGSPVLVDAKLVFNCDGGDKQYVVALDKKTGKEVWKTNRPGHTGRGFSFCTPLILEVKGQTQIVSPGSDAVIAYDVDGGEIWRVNYPGGYSVVPRPVFGEGLVFVCTGYDSPTLLAIRPDGKGDVTRSHLAWQLRRGVPHNPTPLLVDGALYLVSDKGIATCLDAKTGKQIWKDRLKGGFSCSPIYADGHIFVQNEAGMGYVIEPGKKLKLVGRGDLGERSLASYAIADGAIFIRTIGGLRRIRSSD